MDGVRTVHNTTSAGSRLAWAAASSFLGLCLLASFACSGPSALSSARQRPYTMANLNIDAGFGPDARPQTTAAPPWQAKQLTPVSAKIPEVANAKMLNDDELCMTCHESFVKYHKQNVHVNQSCETCHGPGSEHVRSRGKEPGLILSFKTMQPAERAEA